MPRADGGTLLVELLYERGIGLDEDLLLAEVNKALPSTVLAGDDRQPTLLVHEGHGTVDSDDAAVPVMSVLMPGHEDDLLTDRVDLSQTWEFPRAQGVLDRCRSALTVGEMFGRPRAPAERLEVFRVEGTASDVVMDTLGLQVFGLPDLQCHCHGIELPRLATYLRNAANYIFERGDVVRDGDTIEGLEPGEKWRCLQEEALIPPDRLVIDLDPGDDYAAGERFR